MRMAGHERAGRWRALFRSWGGARIIPALALWLLAGPLFAADCAPDRIDERAEVAHVHDGDTLRLADGRSVRLIGINAPELPRRGEPGTPEPHAEAARDALRGLLAAGDEVALRYDEERIDRYGRWLAHLYLPRLLPQGGSIQARLLEDGHALAIAVPPNLWNLACYRAAEGRARAAAAGIWSLPGYRPADASRLGPGADGFRIVRGRVRAVGDSRGSRWLDLEGGVSLRILKEDLAYFRDFPFEGLAGREVLARGWLSPRQDGRGGAVMRLRHPAALELPAQAPETPPHPGAADQRPPPRRADLQSPP